MCESQHIRRSFWGAVLAAVLVCFVNGMDLSAAEPAAAAVGHDHAVETGHAGHDYNKPPLYFDLTMFLFTFVLFGAFILVMRGAVWQPLIHGLDAREGRIAQAEIDAEAARKEVVQLADQAEAKLAEVHQQVAAILAQARTEAEAEKAQITAAAEAEAQRIKQNALDAISRARLDAVEQLEKVADQQVALATEHVAGFRI